MAAAMAGISSSFPNRWMGLVATMWLLSCAGNSYNFAIYSPTLKEVLNYSQQDLTSLGVAKDIGDNVGLLAGLLADVVPAWVVLLMGGLLNFVGYGGLWLILSRRILSPAFWQVWLLLCCATNGSIFLITIGLVVAQVNFPQSGGVVAGIVVGFIGLSGAIFSQLYSTFLSPNHVAFLLLLTVLPSLVALLTIPVVRPFPLAKWTPFVAKEELTNFRLILRICLLLAAFLLSHLITQSLFPSSHSSLSLPTTIITLLLLLSPIVTVFPPKPRPRSKSSSNLCAGPSTENLSEPLLPPIREEDVSSSPPISAVLASRALPPGSLRSSFAAFSPAATGQRHLASGEASEPLPGDPDGATPVSSLVAHASSLGSSFLDMRGILGSSLEPSGVAKFYLQRTGEGGDGGEEGSVRNGRSEGRSVRGRRRRGRGSEEDMSGGSFGSIGNTPYQRVYLRDEEEGGEEGSVRRGLNPGGAWEGIFGEEDISIRGANRDEQGNRFPPRAAAPFLAHQEEDEKSESSEDEEGGAAAESAADPSVEEEKNDPASDGTRAVHFGNENGQRPDEFLPTHPAAAAGREGCEGADWEAGAGGEGDGQLVLGGNFSFGAALGTLDFWLLFASLACVFGSGLAAITNLAQICDALGYQHVQIFTSLISICQFLGRLAGGSVSEHYVRSIGLPRPAALASTHFIMIFGLLAFAFNPPGSVYIGSMIIGFSYGAVCAIVPVLARDLFGLPSLGLLYNAFLSAAPIGSFLLSGLLTGYLYEKEMEREHGHGFESIEGVESWQPLMPFSGNQTKILEDPPGPKTCHGEHCFRLIFIIMSIVCVFGIALALWVALRTRNLYEKLVAKDIDSDVEED